MPACQPRTKPSSGPWKCSWWRPPRRGRAAGVLVPVEQVVDDAGAVARSSRSAASKTGRACGTTSSSPGPLGRRPRASVGRGRSARLTPGGGRPRGGSYAVPRASPGLARLTRLPSRRAAARYDCRTHLTSHSRIVVRDAPSLVRQSEARRSRQPRPDCSSPAPAAGPHRRPVHQPARRLLDGLPRRAPRRELGAGPPRPRSRLDVLRRRDDPVAHRRRPPRRCAGATGRRCSSASSGARSPSSSSPRPRPRGVLAGAVLLGLAYEIVEPPTAGPRQRPRARHDRAFAYSALNASLAVSRRARRARRGSGVRPRPALALRRRRRHVPRVRGSRRPAASPARPASPRRPPTHRDDRRGASSRRRRTTDAALDTARARWVTPSPTGACAPSSPSGPSPRPVTMVVVFGVPLLVEQRGLSRPSRRGGSSPPAPRRASRARGSRGRAAPPHR